MGIFALKKSIVCLSLASLLNCSNEAEERIPAFEKPSTIRMAIDGESYLLYITTQASCHLQVAKPGKIISFADESCDNYIEAFSIGERYFKRRDENRELFIKVDQLFAEYKAKAEAGVEIVIGQTSK